MNEFTFTRVVVSDADAGLVKVANDGAPPLSRWVMASAWARAVRPSAARGWTATLFGQTFGERAAIFDALSLSQAGEELHHYADSSYCTVRALGLSLCFDGTGAHAERALACVHILDKRCTVALPHGLALGMKAVDAVSQLGEPDRKSGGGKGGGVTISYTSLGVQLNFVDASWEKADNEVCAIDIFEPASAAPVVGTTTPGAGGGASAGAAAALSAAAAAAGAPSGRSAAAAAFRLDRHGPLL